MVKKDLGFRLAYAEPICRAGWRNCKSCGWFTLIIPGQVNQFCTTCAPHDKPMFQLAQPEW